MGGHPGARQFVAACQEVSASQRAGPVRRAHCALEPARGLMAGQATWHGAADVSCRRPSRPGRGRGRAKQRRQQGMGGRGREHACTRARAQARTQVALTAQASSVLMPSSPERGGGRRPSDVMQRPWSGMLANIGAPEPEGKPGGGHTEESNSADADKAKPPTTNGAPGHPHTGQCRGAQPVPT